MAVGSLDVSGDHDMIKNSSRPADDRGAVLFWPSGEKDRTGRRLARWQVDK